MKRNVDLTEHRIFFNGSQNIHDALVNVAGKEFVPWDFEAIHVVTSDYELNEPITPFLCGNAAQRQKLREWKMYENGMICERCGAIILRKPWSEFCGFLLCDECNRDLDREYDVKWRFKKENPILESHDFLVIEMNKR